jgi:hypothetical protein
LLRHHASVLDRGLRETPLFPRAQPPRSNKRLHQRLHAPRCFVNAHDPAGM